MYFEVALEALIVTRSTASFWHVLYLTVSEACLDEIASRFLVRLPAPIKTRQIWFVFASQSSSLLPSMSSTCDTSSISFDDDNGFKYGLSDPNVLANQKRAKIFDLLNRLHNTG